MKRFYFPSFPDSVGERTCLRDSVAHVRKGENL